MVEKERLEKLIKQGATIYSTTYSIPIKLKKGMLEENCIYEDYGDWVLEVDFEDLYETEEEVKWIKKMYATREEEFCPPIWEEIKHSGYEKRFVTKKGNQLIEYFLLVSNASKEIDILVREVGIRMANEYCYPCDNYKSIFNGFATKENYIKACEYAKALFLGKEARNETNSNK